MNYSNYVASTLVVVALLFGCQSRKVTAFRDFTSEVSNDVFINFPITPKNIDNSYRHKLIYPAAVDAAGFAGIFIFFQFDSLSFEKRIAELRSRKILEHPVTDTCILSVAIRNNFGEKCSKSQLPVPALANELYSSPFINPFEEDSFDASDRFLVFAAQPGEYILGDDFLTTDDFYQQSINLPDKWQNGFSNGAIIRPTSKEIVFWVIIW